MRERPLWAIATDSLANQCLALGRALGDVPTLTRAGRAPRRRDRGTAAGSPLRRRRRRPLHPAGVVLPARRGARPGDVHLVPPPVTRKNEGSSWRLPRPGSRASEQRRRDVGADPPTARMRWLGVGCPLTGRFHHDGSALGAEHLTGEGTRLVPRAAQHVPARLVERRGGSGARRRRAHGDQRPPASVSIANDQPLRQVVVRRAVGRTRSRGTSEDEPRPRPALTSATAGDRRRPEAEARREVPGLLVGAGVQQGRRDDDAVLAVVPPAGSARAPVGSGRRPSTSSGGAATPDCLGEARAAARAGPPRSPRHRASPRRPGSRRTAYGRKSIASPNSCQR